MITRTAEDGSPLDRPKNTANKHVVDVGDGEHPRSPAKKCQFHVLAAFFRYPNIDKFPVAMIIHARTWQFSNRDRILSATAK
jgi:hypothetical protein